jgi:hypothetical protein
VSSADVVSIFAFAEVQSQQDLNKLCSTEPCMATLFLRVKRSLQLSLIQPEKGAQFT